MKVALRFGKCFASRSGSKKLKHCHFEPFVKRRKIQRNLKHALNLMDTSLSLSMTKKEVSKTK